jgi:hypothetical protein
MFWQPPFIFPTVGIFASFSNPSSNNPVTVSPTISERGQWNYAQQPSKPDRTDAGRQNTPFGCLLPRLDSGAFATVDLCRMVSIRGFLPRGPGLLSAVAQK